MSDTESIKEMLIEMENDEFSLTNHLNSSDASTILEGKILNFPRTSNIVGLGQNLPSINCFVPDWLQAGEEMATAVEEPPAVNDNGDEFSVKMQIVILREENYFLKVINFLYLIMLKLIILNFQNALVQLHRTWQNQKQDKRSQEEVSSPSILSTASVPNSVDSVSPHSSQKDSCISDSSI